MGDTKAREALTGAGGTSISATEPTKSISQVQEENASIRHFSAGSPDLALRNEHGTEEEITIHGK
jgi:hypothetical protein